MVGVAVWAGAGAGAQVVAPPQHFPPEFEVEVEVVARPSNLLPGYGG
jgi:hypothetical protein